MHLRLKIIAIIMLGSFAIGGCRSITSNLSDSLIECKEANERQEAGKGIGRMIAGFILLAKSAISLAVPPVGIIDPFITQGGQATGNAPVNTNPTLVLEKALGGPGCNLLEAKLDYFIQITERRIADIWDKIEEVESNIVESTIIGETEDIKTEVLKLDNVLTVIANDHQDFKGIKGEILSAKESLDELTGLFKKIEKKIQKLTELAYMNRVYSSIIPLGITASILSNNYLGVLARSRETGGEMRKQSYDSIAKFRQSFGNMLWILEMKLKNYPGVELELVIVPDLESVDPPGDKKCALTSVFKVKFKKTKLEYQINAFGKPLGTSFADIDGATFDINLGQVFADCKSVDDHPNYLGALHKTFSESSLSPVAEHLKEVRELHASIDPVVLKTTRDWLNWNEASNTLPGSYFDGFTSSIPWGSKDRGETFSDKEDLLSIKRKIEINEISIRVRDRLKMICITIANWGPLCNGGAKDDNAPETKIFLQAGEYIKTVLVNAKNLRYEHSLGQYSYENRVQGIKITTSGGKTLEGGIMTGGILHTFEAPQGTRIVGFHGQKGDEVDALGVIYSYAR